MSGMPNPADAVGAPPVAPVFESVEYVHPGQCPDIVRALVVKHGGTVLVSRPALSRRGASIIDSSFPTEEAAEAFHLELGNASLYADPNPELTRILLDALHLGVAQFETQCRNSGDIHALTEMRRAIKQGEGIL